MRADLLSHVSRPGRASECGHALGHADPVQGGIISHLGPPSREANTPIITKLCLQPQNVDDIMI